jgi:hypothetical protein
VSKADARQPVVDGQVSGDRINSVVVGQEHDIRLWSSSNFRHKERTSSRASPVAGDLQSEFVLALIWFEEPKCLVPTKSRHDLGSRWDAPA